MPFSALQFAFYEQERNWAKQWVGSRDIGLGLEIVTAASAGGLAGVITCPLDVVKTRIQTQLNPPEGGPAVSPSSSSNIQQQSIKDTRAHTPSYAKSSSPSAQQKRPISTSSPSTTVVKPGSVMLDTSSVITGLKLIYKTEGVAGLFRGVGPRFVWTSVQSGTMLVLYQALLRQMAVYATVEDDGDGFA